MKQGGKLLLPEPPIAYIFLSCVATAIHRLGEQSGALSSHWSVFGLYRSTSANEDSLHRRPPGYMGLETQCVKYSNKIMLNRDVQSL